MHDLSRSELGRGLRVFVAAREAFQRWEQFDLGWVRVVNPMAKITPGELVAVEAHTACLWSINLSRVVEVVDNPTRFGFMYTTPAFHVEEGRSALSSTLMPRASQCLILLRQYPVRAPLSPHWRSFLPSDAAPIRKRLTRADETLPSGLLMRGAKRGGSFVGQTGRSPVFMKMRPYRRAKLVG